MTTVRQKLEQQYEKLIHKFPELETNQMHLGSGSHPDFKVWEEIKNKVGNDNLDKFKRLKFILTRWEIVEIKEPHNELLEVNSLLQQYKMYGLAKLFREEIKLTTKKDGLR
jgi:hypothetical protein